MDSLWGYSRYNGVKGVYDGDVDDIIEIKECIMGL